VLSKAVVIPAVAQAGAGAGAEAGQPVACPLPIQIVGPPLGIGPPASGLQGSISGGDRLTDPQQGRELHRFGASEQD
jgi:hypothetical protein